MGPQVERLPEGAAVAIAREASAFGHWYRRQRELRGISIFYVAARTKLTPERVREIEDSGATLETDGLGRATVRSLALAIGADPDEAATLLGERRAVRGSGASRLAGLRELFWRVGRRAGLVLLLGAGLWLLGLWLSGDLARDPATPEVVYKPDYVEKLLHPN